MKAYLSGIVRHTCFCEPLSYEHYFMPVLREIFGIIFPKFIDNLYQASTSIKPGDALRLFDSIISSINEPIDETKNFEFDILQSIIIFILRLNSMGSLHLFPYKLSETLQKKHVEANKIYEIEVRYILIVLLMLCSKIHDDLTLSNLDFAILFYKQVQNIEAPSNILAIQVATVMRDTSRFFLKKEKQSTKQALAALQPNTSAYNEYKKLRRKLKLITNNLNALYSHSILSKHILWHLNMSECYLLRVLGYNCYLGTTSIGINATEGRSDPLECYLQHHQQELNLPTPADNSSFSEEYLKTLKPQHNSIPKPGIKPRHSF